MKLNKLLTLLLVFSMLLLTSSFAFAEEIQDSNIELINVGNPILLEDELSGPIIDSSEFHAQMKPATELYNGDGIIFQNDKFASYYFCDLKNYFGYNTHGSCGYVAVAMLLSYYDTYLNDNIVLFSSSSPSTATYFMESTIHNANLHNF